MSVLISSHEEIGQLCDYLQKYAERKSYIYLRMGDDLPLHDNIRWFMDRLWSANQFAYYFTYGEAEIQTFTYERLKSDKIQNGHRLSSQEFLNKFSMLIYNTVTNCGRSFVSYEDQARADNIKSVIKDDIIERLSA